MVRLTYCRESYSPDDNRFDLRPFLYPPFYQSFSYKLIDEALEKIKKKAEEKAGKEKEAA
jgi:NAD+ synthase (glutamine-hydrolysing)